MDDDAALEARGIDRRRLLLLLATGAVTALGGATTLALEQSPSEGKGRPGDRSRQIPPPRPGAPVVVDRLPPGTNRLALTVDDGYAKPVVDAYVQFARDTGFHLTFCPNGAYAADWEPHAATLRRLIGSGQVQIANHTFNHPDLRRLTPAAARSQIVRNEAWINKAFGVTSRPWFRPPYGSDNRDTDAIAGELGFTRILMWSGDLGDAYPIRAGTLLRNARRTINAGAIVLGHANHPTVTHLYEQLVSLIRERNLTPSTLDEAFGTSRTVG
ncbi:MAG TPA: polysaccharide deacetylase family protein [Frankiaceae bacterium]|nr:polysaccharide deacetylase family protein [Frankiaceae bacterium]